MMWKIISGSQSLSFIVCVCAMRLYGICLNNVFVYKTNYDMVCVLCICVNLLCKGVTLVFY